MKVPGLKRVSQGLRQRIEELQKQVSKSEDDLAIVVQQREDALKTIEKLMA